MLLVPAIWPVAVDGGTSLARNAGEEAEKPMRDELPRDSLDAPRDEVRIDRLWLLGPESALAQETEAEAAVAVEVVVAGAQPDDGISASPRFDEAVSALEAGEVDRAVELLEAERDENPSDLVGLNLADAYLRQGRPREAAELLAPIAAASGDLLLRDAARDLEATARNRIGSVCIDTEGFDDPVTEIDARVVEGRALVDPGAHTLVVRSDNADPVTRPFEVDAGEAIRIMVRRRQEENSALNFVSPERQRRRRWIGASAGAVVLVTIAVVAIVASRNNEADPTPGNLEPVDFRGMGMGLGR